MVSSKLQQARWYEANCMTSSHDDIRPQFHVTGTVGWINDPNGFSCYKGEYHLFFQYNPYSTEWGPMHWGHVKTKDFICWEHLPTAIAPDMEYDKDGCFSGSALETPAGKHMLMYTGVRRVIAENDCTVDCQIQCIAVGDGLNYRKITENPVLTEKDLPVGGSPIDFRDPRIWYDPEEKLYYSVIGNRSSDGSGSILQYCSKDGIRWNYVGTLAECHNEYGRMWECPDFFLLDGEYVLLVSAQEMKQKDLEFHSGNGTICFMGDYDKKTHKFEQERMHAIDYGLDFYAPQTLETSDGRRIMIAWMQNWSTCNAQPGNNQWFGEMTLPRELAIEDGRLFQKPVREVERYHVNPVIYKNVRMSNKATLAGICGRVLDMTVSIRPADKTGYREFKMNLASGDGFFSSVSYSPTSGEVLLDRSFSGFGHDLVNNRRFLIDSGMEMKVRVIMDRFSVELFFNDGKQAASMILYTPQEYDGISFEADGALLLDVEKYELALNEE